MHDAHQKADQKTVNKKIIMPVCKHKLKYISIPSVEMQEKFTEAPIIKTLHEHNRIENENRAHKSNKYKENLMPSCYNVIPKPMPIVTNKEESVIEREKLLIQQEKSLKGRWKALKNKEKSLTNKESYIDWKIKLNNGETTECNDFHILGTPQEVVFKDMKNQLDRIEKMNSDYQTMYMNLIMPFELLAERYAIEKTCHAMLSMSHHIDSPSCYMTSIGKNTPGIILSHLIGDKENRCYVPNCEKYKSQFIWLRKKALNINKILHSFEIPELIAYDSKSERKMKKLHNILISLREFHKVGICVPNVCVTDEEIAGSWIVREGYMREKITMMKGLKNDEHRHDKILTHPV